MPNWATLEHFNELDRMGLTMYGQMTAGSWIYIGSQGIVQGTYETFSEIARQHFDNDATGRLVVTGGLGGMGGAQALAATMTGFNAIVVECRQSKIEFRRPHGVSRPPRRDAGRGAGHRCRGARRREAGLGRVAGQRGPGARRDAGARCGGRRRYRPDFGA